VILLGFKQGGPDPEIGVAYTDDGIYSRHHRAIAILSQSNYSMVTSMHYSGWVQQRNEICVVTQHPSKSALGQFHGSDTEAMPSKMT
jgi:hypothetical protein